MIGLDFLKKLELPKFDFRLGFRSSSLVGIDIGSESVKVVQLKKERERAVLETYGELKPERYFKTTGVRTLLQYSDQELKNLLADVLAEANVTTTRAVFGVPSSASFLTVIRFPLISVDEITAAVPYEAKKYIPIPTSEVAMDWQIIEEEQEAKRIDVLLVAVPHEIINKFKRVSEVAGLEMAGLEIESFSLVRSLLAADPATLMLLNLGTLITTVTIVDRGSIRMNHNIGRGSREITMALSRSLGVSIERADEMKKSAGLSERPEERSIRDIIFPLIDSVLADVERTFLTYNRTSERKIEKLVLAGGGAKLIGLADQVAGRFGLETVIGNAFLKTVFPPFLSPMLREIAPEFAVAVGLALRP